MRTVAFLYGLGEGAWQSRHLRNLLVAKGYTVIKDPSKADVVIAHSGGCLLVTESFEADLILLTGYTYWPGRNLLYSHLQRQKHGFRTYGLRWIGLTFMNVMYLLWLPHTWKLAKAWPHRALPMPHPAPARFVFVRERYDDFCDPNALLTSQQGSCFVSFRGGHDDCWLNPDRYIDLLELELRSTT